MSNYQWICLATVAVVAVGCGGARQPADRASPRERAEVSIVVENNNFYDATVHTCRGSRRDRLGVVTSNSTRTFTFRWIAGNMRILLEFTGAGGHISEVLSVEPGDELQFRIDSNMHRGPRLRRCIG